MIFSIIIPAYNIRDYIVQCVKSVTSQKNHDSFSYEILLVDDGSTDGTSELCDDLALSFSSVKVIHKSNGGLSSARNEGIRNATGDYIFFLDGDDFWSDQNFLSGAFEILKNNRVDFLLYAYSLYYDEYIKPITYSSVGCFNNFQDDVKSLVMKRIYSPSACTKCIRADLFRDNRLFFPEGMLSEDNLWSANLIKIAKTYHIYNNSQYMYRQNRVNSITSVIKEKNVLDVLRSIDLGISDIDTYDVNVKSALYIYFYIAYLSILPSVYRYKNNHEILVLLEKFEYLSKYGNKIYDNHFKLRSKFVSILGVRVASYVLGKLKYIHNLLKKFNPKWLF